MKLLFDQNLSHTPKALLTDIYPQSAHVRDVGLDRAHDQELWEFAKRHGYIIVSKDCDFFQRSSLHGAPPKVIWLHVGNFSTARIESVLRAAAIRVVAFDRDAQAATLLLR